LLEFTRRDVSRGFTLTTVQAYNSWCTRLNLQEPFLASYVWIIVIRSERLLTTSACRTHAPLYPLPTSFPRILKLDGTRERTIPLFTSLRTTPQTSSLFRTFARFVETNLDLGELQDLDRDDMKELGNDLWGICDGFGDNDGDEILDVLGEDE
jgi:hypothetical protein